MANPLTNLTNPNVITTDGSTVDATSWTTDWSTITNYINSQLVASFNTFSNKGDIMGYTGTVIQALPVGSNNQILTADSTQPTGLKWVTSSTSLPWTTNGDTLYYNAGNGQRLPIGAANTVLTVVGGLPAWATSAASIPVGIITLWSGAINAIPTGWALCDGVSNVSGVNLQGLFVVGAGNQSPAATGGMGLLNPGGPSGNNSAGPGQGPAHTHTLTLTAVSGGPVQGVLFGNTGSTTVTPKYYALCYIEKQP